MVIHIDGSSGEGVDPWLEIDARRLGPRCQVGGGKGGKGGNLTGTTATAPPGVAERVAEIAGIAQRLHRLRATSSGRLMTGSGNCENCGNPGPGQPPQVPKRVAEIAEIAVGCSNASHDILDRLQRKPARAHLHDGRRESEIAAALRCLSATAWKALIFRALKHLFAGAVCLTPHRGSYISRAPLGALRGRSSVG